MGFRVECVDAQSGRAMAGYVTRATSEAEVNAEAVRLGVRISKLVPLDSPPLPDAGEASGTKLWNGRTLRWRVEPSVLFRLGFEHPRWGARLYTTLAASFVLFKWKAMLGFLVASGAGLLAAIGLNLSNKTMFVLVVLIVLVLPLALCKRYVLARLRETHAPEGFPTLHTFNLEGEELVHKRGSSERRVPLKEIREVHELPRFLLITLRGGSEVAVPHQAFASSNQMQVLSKQLARASGARLHREFRSTWVGRKPLLQRNPRLGWFLIGCALLLWVVTMVWLFLFK